MNRTRALLYAALVLAVPLPALALERGHGAAGLDVQASLGACGIADAAISCRIDIAFSHIPDAEYYTASVTAPGGSVVELGTIASGGGGGSSTSASVPFSGNGEYTVTVSAWGYDERGRPDVVKSERAGAGRSAASGRSGPQVEAIEPGAAPAPAEEDPPPAPPAEPEAEQPECPEPPEEVESRRGEPGPDADPAPDPELEETPEPECDAPPEEPLPPPVP